MRRSVISVRNFIFADAIAETEQNMESALTIEEKAQFIQLSRKIENQLEFMK